MAYGDTATRQKESWSPGDIKSYTLAASQAVVKGDIIVVKPDGYAYKAYAAAGGATLDVFVGIAMENITTIAAEVTTLLKVRTEGEAEFIIAGSSIANVGNIAYHESGATGNAQTVTVTAPAHPIRIGHISESISATLCRVKFRGSTWDAA